MFFVYVFGDLFFFVLWLNVKGCVKCVVLNNIKLIFSFVNDILFGGLFVIVIICIEVVEVFLSDFYWKWVWFFCFIIVM